MLETLSRYVELQAIDAERLAVERQLQQYPDKLAALDRRLGEARQVIGELEGRKKTFDREQRRLERELASQEEKARHFKEQERFVKTDKESHALQEELGAAQGSVSALEDEILALMAQSEEAEAREARARSELEETETETARERSRIEEQIASKREKIEALERDAARLRSQLDPRQLKAYDELTERFPGQVVAPVRGHVCGGCYTDITPNTLVAIRAGAEIVRCSRCLRFLVKEDELA